MSTLFYADDGMLFSNLRFENDVKMYGTQTIHCETEEEQKFENDVKIYGTQTQTLGYIQGRQFENDVKMYA